MASSNCSPNICNVTCKENLSSKYQDILSLVILSFILITCLNVQKCSDIRGTQQENVSKILDISFYCFLRLFQSFYKAYLCRLTRIDLFGFLSSKFSPRKILGNRIHQQNFPAADGSPKMLADLILQSKQHICPSENNRN